MDRLDALTATEEDLEADARRQQDFASGLTRQRKKGKLQVLEASVRRIEELQGVQQEVQSLRARVAELMQERREDDALSFLNHVPALRERWRRDDSAAALHSSLLVQVHFSLVIADVADVYHVQSAGGESVRAALTAGSLRAALPPCADACAAAAALCSAVTLASRGLMRWRRGVAVGHGLCCLSSAPSAPVMGRRGWSISATLLCRSTPAHSRCAWTFFQGRRQTVHCPYRCLWQQQHWEVQLTTMAIRTELFETGGQVLQRPTRVLIGFDHFVRLDPA